VRAPPKRGGDRRLVREERPGRNKRTTVRQFFPCYLGRRTQTDCAPRSNTRRPARGRPRAGWSRGGRERSSPEHVCKGHRPPDGTVNFIYAIPLFRREHRGRRSTRSGGRRRDRVLRGEMFSRTSARRAARNGEPIEVSVVRDDPERARGDRFSDQGTGCATHRARWPTGSLGGNGISRFGSGRPGACWVALAARTTPTTSATRDLGPARAGALIAAEPTRRPSFPVPRTRTSLMHETEVFRRHCGRGSFRSRRR